MYTPPAPDEVEISIWGPGYGESILIHALNNEWIVIDSCINPITKRSPVIEYLEKINVNLGKDVKLVAVSHWHDDHIRGISELFECCESADFLMSEALTDKEFLKLTDLFGNCSQVDASNGLGLKEMYKVFYILNSAKKGVLPRQFKVPILASENKGVWASLINPSVRITSLSPSNYSLFQSKQAIASLIPSPRQPKTWLTPKLPNSNHVSVVLWCELPDISLLLGSDLEEDGNPNKGWTAIVNSNIRPQGKASYYKISHHGAVSGDLPDLWDKLLVNDPYAVCTPYNKGTTLPTTEDVKRVCTYTPNAYITSTRKINNTLIKKENAVQRTINESGIKFHQRDYLPGMVRLRKKVGTPICQSTLETFDGASKLEHY